MMIPLDYLVQKYKMKVNGVLHLGANSGQEAEMYKKEGFQFVLWVEALPDVFESLIDHLAKVGCIEACVCLKACIGDVDGKEVTFNISNNESQSSSYLEFGEHAIIHPTVKYVSSVTMKTTRVDTLLKGYDVKLFDLLNVDLQGVELEALKSMGTLLHYFKYAIIEINKKETYKGGALVGEIDEYMDKFGFVRAETGNWVADTWTDGFYIKRDLL